ncbi:MAG: glutaredoxin family protein [Pseudomonadales bacterium]
MAAELVLYSTDHCTLCDRALELLFSMPELVGRSVRVVDVASDDALTDRYGARLPVLAADGGEGDAELDWPFSRERVLDLIAGR